MRPIDTDTGKPSPDYLKLFLPTWVASLDPAPLTAVRAARRQAAHLTMPADPVPRYGLRGRVVTMDASRTILDDGIVWVADGSISDVTAAEQTRLPPTPDPR